MLLLAPAKQVKNTVELGVHDLLLFLYFCHNLLLVLRRLLLRHQSLQLVRHNLLLVHHNLLLVHHNLLLVLQLQYSL